MDKNLADWIAQLKIYHENSKFSPPCPLPIALCGGSCDDYPENIQSTGIGKDGVSFRLHVSSCVVYSPCNSVGFRIFLEKKGKKVEKK